jgi:hypothetical protein
MVVDFGHQADGFGEVGEDMLVASDVGGLKNSCVRVEIWCSWWLRAYKKY